MKYNPNIVTTFLRVDKTQPNILIAIRVHGLKIEHRVYRSPVAINLSMYDKNHCDQLADTPTSCCLAIGTLYRRIEHWMDGVCDISLVLVNNTQYSTILKED